MCGRIVTGYDLRVLHTSGLTLLLLISLNEGIANCRFRWSGLMVTGKVSSVLLSEVITHSEKCCCLLEVLV